MERRFYLNRIQDWICFFVCSLCFLFSSWRNTNLCWYISVYIPYLAWFFLEAEGAKKRERDRGGGEKRKRREEKKGWKKEEIYLSAAYIYMYGVYRDSYIYTPRQIYINTIIRFASFRVIWRWDYFSLARCKLAYWLTGKKKIPDGCFFFFLASRQISRPGACLRTDRAVWVFEHRIHVCTLGKPERKRETDREQDDSQEMHRGKQLHEKLDISVFFFFFSHLFLIFILNFFFQIYFYTSI